MPDHHGEHRPPTRVIVAAIRHERLDRLLEPWIADPRDRAFVIRCMVDEGPVHHRGASYALIALLGRILERLPPASEPRAPDEPVQPVSLRLPPHLREQAIHAEYPIAMPLDALSAIAPDRGEAAALADCLLDGPAHHALANAVMIRLMTDIIHRLPAR